jgi:hypothetical protein
MGVYAIVACNQRGAGQPQGLDTLTNLRLLDLSNNALASIEGLPALPLLQDLWLNHNQLPTLEALHPALEPLQATVTCIYLEGNPAVSVSSTGHRCVYVVLSPHALHGGSTYCARLPNKLCPLGGD